MGHHDGNLSFSADALNDDAWKKPAQELLAAIGKNAGPNWLAGIDELVIVPDGLLWYIPFEALQVPSDGGTVPLISKVRIRYAPTIALSQPDARGSQGKGEDRGCCGKTLPARRREASLRKRSKKSPACFPIRPHRLKCCRRRVRWRRKCGIA